MTLHYLEYQNWSFTIGHSKNTPFLVVVVVVFTFSRVYGWQILDSSGRVQDEYKKKKKRFNNMDFTAL